MLKKILALTLALPMLFLFASCFDETPEVTAAPETTEEIPEEPVIRSFYSGQILYSYDQDDNFFLIPKKDSEEYEKWERIYVDPEANADVLIYYEEGELYEVFYEGEITPMADTTYGYIEKLHSIRILSSPREYDGISYSVSALRQDYNSSAISSVSLNSQGKADGKLMLLAKSREEFTRMANDYFMYDMEMPENPSEMQRRYIPWRNQRRQLLDGFDEEFFESNDLLMLFFKTGSGSERYDIIDVDLRDGALTVNLAMTRGSGSCNIAHWIFFLSVPKSITAVTTEYKNAYTDLTLYSKSLRYGYIGTDIRTKALNYTGKDQPYYTPWIFKAESEDELKAVFELIRNPTGIGAFDDDDAGKAYDTLFGQRGKGYFESNALIVIYRAAPSSGDAFKVSSITTAGDTLTVGITQTERGATEDMSGWLFVFPIHKTVLQNISVYAAE